MLSKCDLVGKDAVASFQATRGLAGGPAAEQHFSKVYALNSHGRDLEEFSMVSYVALDMRDDDCVDSVLAIDHCIQFGEDEEPRQLRDQGDHVDQHDY